MNIVGLPNKNLAILGLSNSSVAFNLSTRELVCETLKRQEAQLSDLGALVVNTGKFKKRSPHNRFIVEDDATKDINWGKENQPISANSYNKVYSAVIEYLKDKKLYVKDAYACSDSQYRLNLRMITETPSSALFLNNMFLRYSSEELDNITPDWTILCVPNFKIHQAIKGTYRENFVIINFSKQQILIGGTSYSGEIKKSIFSVLNLILPLNQEVLPLHCAANVGVNGDTALYFGLFGAHRTTLSINENRKLIGDDEHGWSDNGVFNFEGGCYPKGLSLRREIKSEVYNPIQFGTILENITFHPKTNKPNFEAASLARNARISFPLDHIENTQPQLQGKHPKNIFFFTSDAHGVLPVVSKLTPEQAMYYFISGYSSSYTRNDNGEQMPKTKFSACFGAPFLPLHPTKYAEMLKTKIIKHQTNVWLINTGWTGGAYGKGQAIPLKQVRAIISAILNGDLDKVTFTQQPTFGLRIPTSCGTVPISLLDPKKAWKDEAAYEKQAKKLTQAFQQNFQQYADIVS